MKQRVALPDFNQMWAGHVAASPSPRMHDDGAERAFWRDFMARKSYAPEPSSRQVLRHLRPLLRAMGVDIDPSVYTIPQAREAVRDFLRRKGGN